MEKEYPLHSRYELNSLYDSDRRTFIYDIGKYDKVLIVTNSPELKESQETLINAVWMQNKDITGLAEPQPANVARETDSVRETLQLDAASAYAGIS